MRCSQQSMLRRTVPIPMSRCAQSWTKRIKTLFLTCLDVNRWEANLKHIVRCYSHHTSKLLYNSFTSIFTLPFGACPSQSRAIATTTTTATETVNPTGYITQYQTGIQSSSREETTARKELLKNKKIILAGKLVKRTKEPNTRPMEQLGRNVKRQDLLQQMTRKWKTGDIYSPHDLTGYAMSKFKKRRTRPPVDVLDMLKIDPLKEYKVGNVLQIMMHVKFYSTYRFMMDWSLLTLLLQNVALMADFATETGRIVHSDRTGLRGRNQRRMAKTIRRAIGIGLLPSVHMHPELSQVRLRWRSRARLGR